MKKLIAPLKIKKKKNNNHNNRNKITYRYFYIYLILLFLNLRNAVLNIVKKICVKHFPSLVSKVLFHQTKSVGNSLL